MVSDTEETFSPDPEQEGPKEGNVEHNGCHISSGYESLSPVSSVEETPNPAPMSPEDSLTPEVLDNKNLGIAAGDEAEGDQPSTSTPKVERRMKKFRELIPRPVTPDTFDAEPKPSKSFSSSSSENEASNIPLKQRLTKKRKVPIVRLKESKADKAILDEMENPKASTSAPQRREMERNRRVLLTKLHTEEKGNLNLRLKSARSQAKPVKRPLPPSKKTTKVSNSLPSQASCSDVENKVKPKKVPRKKIKLSSNPDHTENTTTLGTGQADQQAADAEIASSLTPKNEEVSEEGPVTQSSVDGDKPEPDVVSTPSSIKEPEEDDADAAIVVNEVKDEKAIEGVEFVTADPATDSSIQVQTYNHETEGPPGPDSLEESNKVSPAAESESITDLNNLKDSLIESSDTEPISMSDVVHTEEVVQVKVSTVHLHRIDECVNPTPGQCTSVPEPEVSTSPSQNVKSDDPVKVNNPEGLELDLDSKSKSLVIKLQRLSDDEIGRFASNKLHSTQLSNLIKKRGTSNTNGGSSTKRKPRSNGRQTNSRKRKSSNITPEPVATATALIINSAKNSSDVESTEDIQNPTEGELSKGFEETPKLRAEKNGTRIKKSKTDIMPMSSLHANNAPVPLTPSPNECRRNSSRMKKFRYGDEWIY